MSIEKIAAVLAEHQWYDGSSDREDPVIGCTGCDDWFSDENALDNGVFAAHQAAMLEPVIREREQAAWDACDDAWQFARKMDNIEPWGYIKPNPYDTKEEA